MRLHIVVSSLLVATTWPGLGYPQSLAAIARSQRAKARASLKVYTEDDLRAARGRLNFVENENAQEPESAPLALSFDQGFGEDELGAGPDVRTDDEVRTRQRAELQKQVDEENRVISAIHKAIEQAQVDLNDLTQLTFGARRAYLVQIVEDGQKELAKSRQRIADLEEQARRSGFFLAR